MDLGLSLLLAGLASAGAGLFGSSQSQSTPFKGWMSPALGMIDPYIASAVLKRGLQYGIGDQGMYGDIMKTIGNDWNSILNLYKPTGKKYQ